MISKTILKLLLLAPLPIIAVGSARADVIATIGEYNGAYDYNPGDFPSAVTNIGDFTFTIPSGATIVSATISGTFGNDDVISNTAPSDYYVDGQKIEVASCDDALTYTDVCDTGFSPTSWSYTFTGSDLATLEADNVFSNGSLDFNVIQNGIVSVQTGVTTLDIQTAPEPSLIFLAGAGLAAIALLRRRKA